MCKAHRFHMSFPLRGKGGDSQLFLIPIHHLSAYILAICGLDLFSPPSNLLPLPENGTFSQTLLDSGMHRVCGLYFSSPSSIR